MAESIIDLLHGEVSAQAFVDEPLDEWYCGVSNDAGGNYTSVDNPSSQSLNLRG
jgi:hypothetical protein